MRRFKKTICLLNYQQTKLNSFSLIISQTIYELPRSLDVTTIIVTNKPYKYEQMCTLYRFVEPHIFANLIKRGQAAQK